MTASLTSGAPVNANIADAVDQLAEHNAAKQANLNPEELFTDEGREAIADEILFLSSLLVAQIRRAIPAFFAGGQAAVEQAAEQIEKTCKEVKKVSAKGSH